ncbi:chemotaxis protein CheA [Epibacterium sp. Ofav1-8]|uniref:chemotaxis protein CheA n=1 Tax=Epibacterium sp. Ofav1-8 TaxID=2917735 RepID=UPI001EF4B770|nr:chemotaxis protein CheA [Epibacterium sp. Ofav1-8]MCG7624554.1 chemotaxis protein CheA [Epibacterium sp. Ofav1-8]
MYQFAIPPSGHMVTLPGAIASANGPKAAALSLSSTESLTANQLQNHVTQARRVREKLIEQVSKPPEPGWKTAMNQVADTVEQMEKVLAFLQSQAAALPATPEKDMGALAVYPSGAAMQQSGRTSDTPPSAAESPTVSTGAAADTAATAPARPPRVIYVMEDGVVIVGLPPEPADPGTRADRATDATAAPAQADRSPQAAASELRAEAPRNAAKDAPSTATVVNLPLTDAQKQASQDLIALARKAYAQLQPASGALPARSPAEDTTGALISDETVGLTGALSQPAPSDRTAERLSTRPEPLASTSVAATPHSGSPERTAPQDPLMAVSPPYDRDPLRAAADAAAEQQMMALHLEGTNDIIYVVPPAKAAMDLIA